VNLEAETARVPAPLSPLSMAPPPPGQLAGQVLALLAVKVEPETVRVPVPPLSPLSMAPPSKLPPRRLTPAP
jgi:hypothetical protein